VESVNIEKQIDDLMDKYSEELTEDQVRVLPLMCFGMSTNKISKITGIAQATLRQWAKTDMTFRSAIREFRQYSDLYHVMMLNQAATMAWDRVFEYLESDYNLDDKINRSNQARIAQFILGELKLGTRLYQKEEQEEKPHLNVSEESADIIARKVHELQKEEGRTVESKNYTIEDAASMNANDPRLQYSNKEYVNKIAGPDRPEIDLSEESYGFAAKHPLTEYGLINFDAKNKTRCHVCGEKVSDLVLHIRSQHELSPKRYRTMFGIAKEIVLMPPDKVTPADDEDIESYNEFVDNLPPEGMVESDTEQSTDDDNLDISKNE